MTFLSTFKLGTNILNFYGLIMRTKLILSLLLLSIIIIKADAQNITFNEIFDYVQRDVYDVTSKLKKKGYLVTQYKNLKIFTRNTSHGLIKDHGEFAYFKNPKAGASLIMLYEIPGDMEADRIIVSTNSVKTLESWKVNLRNRGYKCIESKSNENTRSLIYQKKGHPKLVFISESTALGQYSIMVFNPYT